MYGAGRCGRVRWAPSARLKRACARLRRATAAAETKAGALAHDLVKAQECVRLQSLTAPIDGVVQQLAVHTVGGVVTPAQALMVVMPSETSRNRGDAVEP